MTTVLIHNADWPATQPVDRHRVLSGAPETRTLVLHRDTRVELGLWKATRGEFTTVRQGCIEFITLESGRGQLIHDNGEVIELRPDTVVVLEDGWAGRWIVEETIVKTYAIISSDS